jgi:hypothetical protein
MSALLGAVVTIVLRRDPGTVLGVVVVIGTLVACLAVRARSVRLLIPAPTLSYVPAAMIAGVINDRATDTSHYMDLLNAGSWIANGFLMMALATFVAVAFTGLRVYLRWHYGRQPQSAPRSRPVGADHGAASRAGTDPDVCGNCGISLELDLNGRCRRCHAPRGARRPGLDPVDKDQTRPIGSTSRRSPASGPYQAQDTTGPARTQDTGPARTQDTTGPARTQDTTGPARVQDSGLARTQDTTGPARVQDTGPYRPRDTRGYQSSGGRRPSRPAIGGPPRPQIAGPARTQDSGPYRPQDTGPYRDQPSGPYQAREPYGSGAYPEPADLLALRRAVSLADHVSGGPCARCRSSQASVQPGFRLASRLGRVAAATSAPPVSLSADAPAGGRHRVINAVYLLYTEEIAAHSIVF